jgi:hypothetical protein
MKKKNKLVMGCVVDCKFRRAIGVFSVSTFSLPMIYSVIRINKTKLFFANGCCFKKNLITTATTIYLRKCITIVAYSRIEHVSEDSRVVCRLCRIDSLYSDPVNEITQYIASYLTID